jgi:hypothetical protein
VLTNLTEVRANFTPAATHRENFLLQQQRFIDKDRDLPTLHAIFPHPQQPIAMEVRTLAIFPHSPTNQPSTIARFTTATY